MNYSISINNKFTRLHLHIKDIHAQSIKRNFNDYIINIFRKNFKLKIIILKNIFQLVEKRKISDNNITFSKNNTNNTYIFINKINLKSNSLQNKLNSLNLDTLSFNGIKIKGYLALKNINNLNNKYNNQSIKPKSQKKKQLKQKRKPMAKKYNRNLLESINKYEKNLKDKDRLIKENKKNINELRKKGIYLRKNKSKFICKNCTYYYEEKCRIHNVTVTDYHGCNR